MKGLSLGPMGSIVIGVLWTKSTFSSMTISGLCTSLHITFNSVSSLSSSRGPVITAFCLIEYFGRCKCAKFVQSGEFAAVNVSVFQGNNGILPNFRTREMLRPHNLPQRPAANRENSSADSSGALQYPVAGSGRPGHSDKREFIVLFPYRYAVLYDHIPEIRIFYIHGLPLYYHDLFLKTLFSARACEIRKQP